MGAFVGVFEFSAFVARREACLKKSMPISYANTGFVNEAFHFTRAKSDIAGAKLTLDKSIVPDESGFVSAPDIQFGTFGGGNKASAIDRIIRHGPKTTVKKTKPNLSSEAGIGLIAKANVGSVGQVEVFFF